MILTRRKNFFLHYYVHNIPEAYGGFCAVYFDDLFLITEVKKKVRNMGLVGSVFS
jgi:hypothetical protein